MRTPEAPDELLNYRLSRLFALAGAPVIRLCEGRYGITRREFRLLSLLVRNGAMSPSRLSELAHLDLARTSRVITSLVRKNLIRREVQTHNRRFVRIEAADEGHDLYQTLFPQVAEINRRVVSVLRPDQVRVLDDLLSVLTDHAEIVNRTLVLDVQADRARRSAR